MDFGCGELGKEDAEGARIGEGLVGLAGEGEVGVELDGVAYVDGDEEGRPALSGGEGLGVTLGLGAGGEHGLVPARSVADGGTAAGAAGGEGYFGGRSSAVGVDRRVQRPGIAALFGFEDEAVTTVEVDVVGSGGSVEIAEVDDLVEDVGVGCVVGLGRIGAGETKEVAELGEEEGVVGALGG